MGYCSNEVVILIRNFKKEVGVGSEECVLLGTISFLRNVNRF